MTDRSRLIFGNEISGGDYGKAVRSKAKFARKFGDDSGADYSVKLRENPCLFEPLGVYDLRVNEGTGKLPFDR